MQTVDRLLETLDHDPALRCFVLDGQNIILEDYLEVRPENRERLTGLINSGRIHVGPWYVLADSFLTSGEAAIRNLWMGERVARSLGVRSRPIGYLPDQFGHIGQMPQILRGFGIDSAVVWRGFGAPPPAARLGDRPLGEPGGQLSYPRLYNDDGRFPSEMQSEFRWQAPDRTEVYGIYMALEYYRSHNTRYPDDPEREHSEAVERLRQYAEHMRPYAASGIILEPYGGDHLPVDPRLAETVAAVALDVDGEGIEYRLASLEEYLEMVRERLPRPEVTWRGEGRAYGRKAHLLPGVLSSRLHLKRLNRDTQSQLERYAEPLQAFNWIEGGRYEQEYLWLAWKHLLQNHPHDSICGCSIDQVHREMLPRFAQAQQVGELLALRAADELWMGREPEARGADEQPLVVFNPLNWTRTEAVSVRLWSRYGVNEREWLLRNPYGEEVPFQARPEASGKLQRVEHNDWTEVSFVARDLPGLGWRRYILERRGRPVPTRVRTYSVTGVVARDKGAKDGSGLRVGPGVLENEHLRVTVEPSGTLHVLDHATGLEYRGLNGLRDGGDEGDTYAYSAPVGDQLLTFEGQAKLTLLEAGPARATLRVTREWALPSSLTEDRLGRSPDYVPVAIHSDVTLAAGARRIDIRTHFVNPACDHRLQATFPLGAPIVHSSAESVFEVVDRPAALPEGERGSAEPAVPEHPQQAFSSVSDGERGLTIANRGLPEFSASPDGVIALTLLRSVGWLSREDFLARVGGAGPQIGTPEAQMLGEVEARYSIVPHAGTWIEARSHMQAHAFNAEPLAVPLRMQGFPIQPPLPARSEPLADEGAFVEVIGDVVVTAVKRAEDGERLVIRLLNESPNEAPVRLRTRRPFQRALLLNLAEEEIGHLERYLDGWLDFALAPWRLVTLGFEF